MFANDESGRIAEENSSEDTAGSTLRARSRWIITFGVVFCAASRVYMRRVIDERKLIKPFHLIVRGRAFTDIPKQHWCSGWPFT